MSALRNRDPRPIGVGAVAGAAAYVVGYLATYLWQASNVRQMLRAVNAILQFFGGETIPTWKAVGWLLYNAHFVPFTHPALGGGYVQRNWIASGAAPTLLYALPPLLLFVVGAVVAYDAGTRGGETGGWLAGARDGAMVVVGYAPLAAVGVFLFTVTRGEYVIRPAPFAGVFLAGVVYPVVFGALGGSAVGTVREEPQTTSE